jgi:hypothetical protein
VTPPTSPGARTPSVAEAREAVMRHYRASLGCGREHAALLDALLTAVRQEERERPVGEAEMEQQGTRFYPCFYVNDHYAGGGYYVLGGHRFSYKFLRETADAALSRGPRP